MSGIAEVLLASGVPVSGSDISETAITRRLREGGASIFIGHSRENLKQPTCVVVSTAVSRDNIEYKTALELKIPVIPRAEMLAELMRLKLGIAVAGSHGKTTTTSMVGQFLKTREPSVVVGGRLQHWNASSLHGTGEPFVIEADESDRSFLKFSPVYSIVTNIDREHMDTYRDFDDLKGTFLDFMNRTAFFGRNWIGFDCPVLRDISASLSKPFSTYGIHPDSDLLITDIEMSPQGSIFSLSFHGRSLGRFSLPVVGLHNVKNAAGAIGVCLSMKMDLNIVRDACASFVPADRRLQVHFEDDSVAVVEDYGHHPTEIQATLDALHVKYPGRDISVVFQPHRYTRTRDLFNDFSSAFLGRAKDIVLLPIYSAHEKVIPGISSQSLAATFQAETFVYEHIPTLDELILRFEKSSSRPRVLLVLGASPLTTIASGLAAFFGKRSKIDFGR